MSGRKDNHRGQFHGPTEQQSVLYLTDKTCFSSPFFGLYENSLPPTFLELTSAGVLTEEVNESLSLNTFYKGCAFSAWGIIFGNFFASLMSSMGCVGCLGLLELHCVAHTLISATPWQEAIFGLSHSAQL